MDDLKRVAQQFAQAAQIAGPTSYIPEVQSYSQAGSIEGAIKQGLSAGGALSSEKAKQADQADEAARKAAMQRIADQLDPSKYRKVRKSDGGFDFYDPQGNQIDISRYAQLTGQRRVDILKDSENPIDQQYINDWSNMNDLAQAMYNNDTTTVKSFVDQNPDLKNKKPEELYIELLRRYPHMYRTGSYGDTLKYQGNAGFKFNKNYIGGEAPAATSGGGGWRPS